MFHVIIILDYSLFMKDRLRDLQPLRPPPGGSAGGASPGRGGRSPGARPARCTQSRFEQPGRMASHRWTSVELPGYQPGWNCPPQFWSEALPRNTLQGAPGHYRKLKLAGWLAGRSPPACAILCQYNSWRICRENGDSRDRHLEK